MPDRNQMLKAYLNNSLLHEFTELSEDKISKVSFSSNSEEPLIEALKKLIFSYCQSNAQVTVIRDVNREIEKNS